MPSVLVLCEFAAAGGGDHSLLATLPTLAEAGWKVCVAGPAGGTLAREAQAHCASFIPLELRAEPAALSPELARERLEAFLHANPSDLVHANSLSMSRLSGPVVAATERPSLGHVRDIVRISRQAMVDVNRHARLLAVSQATREYHVAQGMSEDRSWLLYNGVDLELFAPSPKRGWLHRELELPPEAVLVGTIGQLILRKGLDLLPAAFTALAGRFPRLHWLIVGPEHSTKPETVAYVAQIKQQFRDAGLDRRVHFLGPREDIARLLNELTLLVHPARQEPLGRVLLEGAATGLPIVATDVGGTGEIFPPARAAARFVPAGDAAALSRAVAELLEDPALRAELGRRARQRMVDAFDCRVSARGLLAHYEAVLLSG